jgi:hypothetical protein
MRRQRKRTICWMRRSGRNRRRALGRGWLNDRHSLRRGGGRMDVVGDVDGSWRAGVGV